jgi:5-methylcytosine-specific restriction protein A
MTEDKEFELGRYYTRAELVATWGGSKQSGIAPSAKTKNVLVYTDPEVGEKHGYHDTLNLRDDYGPLVWYTGAGDDGDQHFAKGSDNYRLLHHKEQGRTIRLFQAAGRVKGTDTKLHKYLGEYELDEGRPYFERLIPDGDGGQRTVMVFQLRPLGPVADPAVEPVVIPPGQVYLDAHPERELRVLRENTSRLVDPERNAAAPIVRKPTGAVSARRREADLTDRFRAHLESHGNEVKRFELGIEGLTSELLTDLFDVTNKVLYEAKGRTDRNSIRLAIGQLFDYRRHAVPKPESVAILLPEAPNEDLRDLIASVGISLVYEENGKFIGWPIGAGALED